MEGLYCFGGIFSFLIANQHTQHSCKIYASPTARPGLYRIHVLVNGTALPDTPVDCHVFPSHDLEFEQEGEHLHPADNSEPSDSVLLQSDHRTVLIANQQTQHSCKIYASPTARPTYLPKLPMQCWRVKLTLACARLVIKLGNVI